MSVQDQHPYIRNTVRFDRFEVQVDTGILLCEQERVKIQDLPLRLLLVLLETPGHVVSTEDLGQRLGSPGNPLELGSLRVAATKLREALGDNATSPRFIKTISGQGYKFIASVASVAEAPAEVVTARMEEVEPQAAAPPLQAAKVKEDDWPARWRAMLEMLSLFKQSRRIQITAVTLTVISAGVVIWAGIARYRGEGQVLRSDQNTLVLGGFTNETGNHDMDDTLSSAFQVKMEESPYLRLVASRKFRELVRYPEAATLNEELNACRALQGQVLLRGRLSAHQPGSEVVLTAWTCSDGQQLSTQRIEADSKADILTALNLVTERMRRRLGEPDDTLQKFNVPLSQATTSSLAALRAFTQGEEKRMQGLESESIPDYKFAADLDPQFALAFARLGAIYFNGGEYVQSRENFQKAFELRGRTTDRERLYITANYYGFTTGEIKRATEAYELWHKIYPRDIAPINNLAIEYLLIGEPEKAVELARTAIQLDPTAYLQYATWTQAYLKTGDFASLNALCDGPVGQGNNSPVFHMHCFQGAYAQNDEAAMKRHLEWAQGKPQQGLLLQEAALVALCRGKAAEGWRLLHQAKEVGLKNDMVEFAAGTMLNEATFKADFGLTQEARAEALQALKLTAGGADTHASAAQALARAGDIADAQVEANKATAQSPLDTLMNSATLAAARAAMHLERHEPAAAAQALEVARPYDFNEFMYLAPAYYRGLAYMQGKHLDLAAKEFQRVLDHRVLAPDSPYVPLARLQLGRTLQLAGDSARAAAAYRFLDALWKDADEDFPPLKQLRSYERQLTM